MVIMNFALRGTEDISLGGLSVVALAIGSETGDVAVGGGVHRYC